MRTLDKVMGARLWVSCGHLSRPKPGAPLGGGTVLAGRGLSPGEGQGLCCVRRVAGLWYLWWVDWAAEGSEGSQGDREPHDFCLCMGTDMNDLESHGIGHSPLRGGGSGMSLWVSQALLLQFSG